MRQGKRGEEKTENDEKKDEKIYDGSMKKKSAKKEREIATKGEESKVHKKKEKVGVFKYIGVLALHQLANVDPRRDIVAGI